MRAKNNQPIFGVLTQPIPDEWRNDLELTYSSFFESSHVDFLQAAGARVVPIDFTLNKKALEKELASINGVYIPGDSKNGFEDSQYLTQVSRILAWAGSHNLEDDKHFPIVGVSYGMLAMLRSQSSQTSIFTDLDDNLVGEALQMNLNLLPKETFVYDEFRGWDLEKTLDEITFYHEMDTGIKLSDFITSQQLRQFVPVSTYDQGKKNDSTSEETIAMIEGTYYPMFGFSYRVDKVQFG